MPESIAGGGFPDAGDGRYSEKLSYSDWYVFNQVVRAHQHFVEVLPAILTILFLSGLFLPMTTVVAAYLTILLKLVSLLCMLVSKEGFG